MKSIMLIILFFLPLWGDIDAQIEAIQQAPVSERFKLMNDFKKKIVKMKEKKRLKAIKKLQETIQNKHDKKFMKALKNKYKERDDELDDLRDDHIDDYRDDMRDNEKDDL